MIKYYLDKIIDAGQYYRIRNYMEGNRKLTSEKNPIFIIGSGRSGTTLLRREIIEKLGGNIPPETGGLIPNLLKVFYWKRKEKYEQVVAAVCRELSRSTEIKLWDIDLQDLEVQLLNSEPKAPDEIIKFIYDFYASTHGYYSSLWGDKSPWLTYKLNWLLLMFPHAKFIHIFRNPLNVITSRMKNFDESFETAFNRWKWAIKSVIRLKSDSNPTKLFEIGLEEFVDNQPEWMDQLSNFLNRDFSHPQKLKHMGDLNLDHMRKVLLPSDSKNTEDITLDEKQIEKVRKSMVKLPKIYQYDA